MKKIMSIAAVTLMLAGTTVFAGEECEKDSKKADEKECPSACSKKAEA